jgi:hypothetical protein
MKRPRLTIIIGGKSASPTRDRIMDDEIDITPRAGMTFADVDAFRAARKAEALLINPANCTAFRSYCQVMDPYGVLVLPDKVNCLASCFFVRNLPDGDWVWEGDLSDDIRKEIVRIKQAEPEDDCPF